MGLAEWTQILDGLPCIVLAMSDGELHDDRLQRLIRLRWARAQVEFFAPLNVDYVCEHDTGEVPLDRRAAIHRRLSQRFTTILASLKNPDEAKSLYYPATMCYYKSSDFVFVVAALKVSLCRSGRFCTKQCAINYRIIKLKDSLNQKWPN